MGPRPMSKSKVKAALLLLGIIASTVTVVVGHTPDKSKEKDDLLEEDNLAEDGVFPVKLDDYEIEYKTPTPPEPVHFYETFDDVNESKKRWIQSRAQKEDVDNVFKYDGQWEFELPERRIFPNDLGLVLRSKAKHAAISAKLSKKFEFTTKPLIVQYEVTFQNGMECGGAYIKLLSDSKDLNLEQFHDKTPYTIMFGPDKCGNDIKLHFIFRHKNPMTGAFEEKHAKRPSNRVEEAFNDKKPHLYKLVLKPDNRFEVYVDGLLINQGSLLEDMEPPVNPPIEIEDPDDKKPADWDEREKIPDENAKKPDDWDDEAPARIPDPSAKVPEGWLEDEPEMIPDPTAKIPEDWDENMDGDWEAPLIQNPNCLGAVGCGPWTAPLVENPNFRGKWNPPLVSNPNYKGQWTRRRIPNPNYFEDKEPFKMTPIAAVGIEIWTMTDLVLFDNFIISDKESAIADFTENTYQLKSRALERDSRGVFKRIIDYSNAHPWLYAVYTIVFGLPLVIFIAFCFGGGNKDKKFDAPFTEGDEQEDEAINNTKTSNHEPREGSDGVPTLRPSKRDGVAKRAKDSASEAPLNVAQSKDDLEEDPADKIKQTGSNRTEAERAQDNGDVEAESDENENEEPSQDEEDDAEDDVEVVNGADDDEEEEEKVIDEVKTIPEPENEAPVGLKKRRTRRD